MPRSRAFALAAVSVFLIATVGMFIAAGLSLGEQIFVEPWINTHATLSDRALSIVPALVVAAMSLRVLRTLAGRPSEAAPLV